jgi:AcrR family transcriptional regulator
VAALRLGRRVVGGGGPEPPWSSRRAKPPARAPLSREVIVDAAMRILDSHGLDGLSMRRVADALGTGPASLAHVSGKDELVELMLDRLAGRIVVPDPDPDNWQEQVKDFVRAVFREFVAHPGLAGANLGKIPAGPGTMATIDRFLGLLRAGGLPDRVVAFAALPAERFPNIAALRGDLLAAGDGDERFEFGLEMLVAGIAAQM